MVILDVLVLVVETIVAFFADLAGSALIDAIVNALGLAA